MRTYVSLKKVAYLADSENIVLIVCTYFLKKGFCFSNAFHLLHIFEHSLLLDFKVGKLHNAYIISSIVCESKVKKLENNQAWAVYWTNDSY